MSASDPELLAVTLFLQGFDLTSVDDNLADATRVSDDAAHLTTHVSISPTKACRAQHSRSQRVAVASRKSKLFQRQTVYQAKRIKPRCHKSALIERQRVYNQRSEKKKIVRIRAMRCWLKREIEAQTNRFPFLVTPDAADDQGGATTRGALARARSLRAAGVRGAGRLARVAKPRGQGRSLPMCTRASGGDQCSSQVHEVARRAASARDERRRRTETAQQHGGENISASAANRRLYRSRGGQAGASECHSRAFIRVLVAM